MPHDVLAVVPTFRPSARVIPLVRGLTTHCEVLVSDDASPCSSDPIFTEIDRLAEVSILRHHRNVGIARGLNNGLHRARQLGATWLLTVDQDTDLPLDYVHRLLHSAALFGAAEHPVGVIGAGVIRDASGVITYPTSEMNGLLVTEEVIQSGSLWFVEALVAIGGFDESLAMDAVDAAACLALREVGYRVCVAPQLSLEHRIGHAKTLRIFGKAIMVTGHNPDRRASMLANRLKLFPREFRQSPRHATRTVRRVLVNQMLGLLIETDRSAKIRGSLRGLSRTRWGHK